MDRHWDLDADSDDEEEEFPVPDGVQKVIDTADGIEVYTDPLDDEPEGRRTHGKLVIGVCMYVYMYVCMYVCMYVHRGVH